MKNKQLTNEKAIPVNREQIMSVGPQMMTVPFGIPLSPNGQPMMIPPVMMNMVQPNGVNPSGVPVVVGPVYVSSSQSGEAVSVGNINNTHMQFSGSVNDPNAAPANGVTMSNVMESSLIAGAVGTNYAAEKDLVKINPGDVVFETDIPGLRYDFNDGVRVKVPKGDYEVKFIDLDECVTLFSTVANDVIVTSSKKYFVRFRVEVRKSGSEDILWAHEYNAKNKNVWIKYPSSVVVGDTLAWIPYAEEFRKKYEANVYVTMNPAMIKILEKGYPQLHFVPMTEKEEKDGIRPVMLPKDIYATYVVGVFFPCDNRDCQPCDFRVVGLHKSTAYELGVDTKEEYAPRLLPSEQEKNERKIKERYVCIATNGSSQAKQWNNARGWLDVVKYLKKLGYRVLCIEKENYHQVGSYSNVIPFGCEDFTGDRPFQERVDLLYHADFFIGVSSGLSWMAWGVGIPVIMISGFTLPINEFYTPYRIINYHVCNGCWNDTRITFDHNDGEWCPRHKNTERQFECSRNISPERVIKVIDKLMQDYQLPPPKELDKGNVIKKINQTEAGKAETDLNREDI